MPSKPAQKIKELLGYQLKERIGVGGYGEVWSAVAPGGLMKAVKLVYGYHDENRAQTELKAMARVKQVRHPFLISLERIEILEGQLVVVSELADGNLAEVYEKSVADGNDGIPRDELLKYIHDAAEGLDYLYETHSLQHLDVKPENLLMVSGHVKVADFGLVKDLRHAAQTMMTGMTPAYAAPELFDGTPSPSSDQYSLAIVYQEMLTSSRPFAGSTPAQLAAQHLHGRPNLRALPKSDQPIIAKALSKDPKVRFKNCREMVAELKSRKLNRKRTIRRISDLPREDESTIEVDTRGGTSVLSKSQLSFQPVEMKTLAPPHSDVENTFFQPTCIITIGNTANQVAQKIKQRMVVRHGSAGDVPAVKVLCFDSDRQAITRLTMTGKSDALNMSEVVDLPLYKPEVYRQRAQSHLGWLSRRWIYNVPRTLQTEGLRPLGRLAFADHFDRVCKSVQESFEDITAPENVASTADAFGIPPAEKIAPRIFLISSISGGIGSGMTLDMAYTVKTLLAENGWSSERVSGILLHSTDRTTREAGLASANAFSFLTELRHYNDFGYPGDNVLGIPEFEEEPPLDYVYYQNLGVDLTQESLDAELDKLAEYVYLNCATKCSAFFDACRAESDEFDHFSLRTFGLNICGGSSQSGKEMIGEIARALIDKWDSKEYTPNSQDVIAVEEWFHEFDLHFDGVSNHYADQFDEVVGDQKINRLVAEIRNIIRNTELEDPMSEVRDFLDAAIGCPLFRKNTSHIDPEISHEFDCNVSEDALALGERFSKRIYGLMDSERLDLAAQFRLLNACETQLNELKASFDEQTHSCTEQLTQIFIGCKELIESGRKSKKGVDREAVQQFLDTYFQFRIQEFILRYSKAFCLALGSSLISTKSILSKYSKQLVFVKSQFEAREKEKPKKKNEKNARLNMRDLMVEHVLSGMGNLTSQIELHLFHSVIEQREGYKGVFNETVYWQQQLPKAVFHVTQRIVADAFRKLSLDKIIAQYKIQPKELIHWLGQNLNKARPVTFNCGGSVRTMIGLPEHSSSSMLGQIVQDQFDICSAQINGTSGDLAFCFEGEDVSLASVAYKLLEQAPDVAPLAKRIHTRDDVKWTTLDDLL